MNEHCGYIVMIKNLEKHPNADRLMITTLFMENVIVSTDVNIGDVGVYFPSDLQLSAEFCDYNHLCRANSKGEKDTGYMDPNKRNVKAIKLRGVFSDGIYCPLSSLDYLFADGASAHFTVGDTVDIVNGVEVCKKYIPRQNTPTNRAKTSAGKVRKTEREKTPYFAEHIDTPQLRFCADKFHPGDIICLTEKVHGTSSRNANTLAISYKKNWFDKLFHRKGKEIKSYKYVVGTRRTTVQDKNAGYYGDNNFRLNWGKKFVGKLRQGEEVFGEIAGFIAPGTPIMGRVKNSKISDKSFSKRYGDTTTFSYGCAENDETKPLNRYFIYRMTYTTPEGDVIEYPWDMVKYRAEQLGFEVVPELDRFIYTTEKDFYKHINQWLDRPSTIDPAHVIEGVVIRALNSPGFNVAKEKSISFKILEGIMKEEEVAPDMEEAEELIEEIEE